MIKLSITFVFTLFAVSFSIGQKQIDVREIMDKINQGAPVRYENAEISGHLDLTALDNREITQSSKGWFSSNGTYESTVESTLTFVNCTFLDDVIAYYHHKGKEDTFIANFEKEVVFRNCTFKKASEFKYSEFSENASFQGSVFREEANFKYAEFSEAPDFRNTVFEDNANFKYAEFPRQTKFTAAVFEEEANFKYADFPSGADFEKAVFNGLANFKYSKFSEPLNMKNISFNGSEDFKYTKVEGKDFTTYLLQNR